MSDDDWIRRRKIATHPSAKVDPTLALHRVLEKVAAGEIQSVYIGIEWTRDRGFTADWSNMPVGHLAIHAMQAMREATRETAKKEAE